MRSRLKLEADTVYVDCGTHNGDTIKLFLEAADHGYRKAFAFEPDPTMQASLHSLAATQDGRVGGIATGVGNCDGTISFVVDGVFSAIVQDGFEASRAHTRAPRSRTCVLLARRTRARFDARATWAGSIWPAVAASDRQPSAPLPG